MKFFKINRTLKPNYIIVIIAACAAIISLLITPVQAQTPTKVLIKNVSIFNGTSEKLITGKDVVLVGNKIDKLIPSGSGGDNYDQVIDGNGGYLTPGLIDVHSHAIFGASEETFFNGGASYVQLYAAMKMGEMLMRGVTTIRDPGGETFGLKKAFDEGIMDGPRIYPSGAMISQYSGHGDFRPTRPMSMPKEWGGQLEPVEVQGHIMLANGVRQVQAAVRQQLFLGATQIKLAAGGEYHLLRIHSTLTNTVRKSLK